MSVASLTSQLQRKREELAKLGKKRSDIQAKVSQETRNEANARTALGKARTDSQIRQKQRALQTATDHKVKAQKDLSDIEKRYARLEKEVTELEKRLAKEQENEAKKAQKAADALQRKNDAEHARYAESLRSQGAQIGSIHRRVAALEYRPEQISVLMMASAPEDQAHLRLDREAREIREAIERARHRDSVLLEDRWAVRTRDLFQAMNSVEPTIVHFSGHGASDGSLVFEDEFGGTKLVTPSAMATALATMADKVRLLVFNACFSEAQAAEVVNNIEAAIGMSTSIGDDAAVIFASTFYSAIGFGLSLEKAFNQARAALAMDCPGEHETPQLYVADGLDASEIFYVSEAE